MSTRLLGIHIYPTFHVLNTKVINTIQYTLLKIEYARIISDKIKSAKRSIYI